MNKVITHYLLVTNVVYSDGENTQRYNTLLWWNVKHCNVTLKLRTVIRGCKPISVMTLVTPADRTDLLDEFNELVNKVNGLYPEYALRNTFDTLTIKDEEEDKAYHTQH